MKEKIKSILLILLVLNSIVLTWILIYYSPNDGNATISEYLPRFRFGKESSMQEIVQIKQIILHFGNNQHTIIYPESKAYPTFLQEIKKASFYDIALHQQPVDWKTIIESQKGIELILPGDLPQDVLSSILMISSPPQVFDQVNRIWVTSGVDNTTVVYFLSDHDDKVYTAKTSLSMKNMETLLTPNQTLPQYSYLLSQSSAKKAIKKFYYLPEEELQIQIPRRTLVPISEDHLVQIFFLDPTGVRKVYDRKESQRMIYTDGSRSMQVYTGEHYLNYYQPVVNVQRNLDRVKDLKTGINYINQHGGWEGNYYLTSLKTIGSRQWEFQFNQYMNGIPVREDDLMPHQVQINNGSVSFVQIPTMLLIESESANHVSLKKRAVLMGELKKENIASTDIDSMELIFQMVQKREFVEFYPYWEIILNNKKQVEIPADQSGVL
ncbi:two-component system activity regulator YycH [Tepidibacillus marianensis]|uniref:YycH family regulatory protein n=1 Tax=Tepidibacillus marianensis TaxID=3131995 RepID=UPI0030D3599F